MQSGKHWNKTTNISFRHMAVFFLNYSSLQDPAKDKTYGLYNHQAPEKEWSYTAISSA